LSEGYFAETVDHMLAEAQSELQEMRVKLYTRWHFTWASKCQMAEEC